MLIIEKMLFFVQSYVFYFTRYVLRKDMFCIAGIKVIWDSSQNISLLLQQSYSMKHHISVTNNNIITSAEIYYYWNKGTQCTAMFE